MFDRTGAHAMYYPEGVKARVIPMQSIEPHRTLAPTRDSNQEPPGPQSRVVTTIILYRYFRDLPYVCMNSVEISCQIKSFDTDLKFAVYGTMTETRPLMLEPHTACRKGNLEI